MFWIIAGDVLIKMGRHQEALDVYQKALTFEPDNPDLHYNLGVVHIETGHPDKALSHFEKAERKEALMESNEVEEKSKAIFQECSL